jgi:hypothetical protein
VAGGIGGRGLVRARLGDTDCEAFRSGVVGQPVNSLSSLAFLVVGGALVGWARQRPPGQRLLPTVFGGTIIANFVGGVLYHGPAWTGSGWIHDLALLAPMVFIVLYDVSTIRPLPARGVLVLGAVVLGVLGIGIAIAARYAIVANAVLAALIIGTELVAAPPRYAYRRSRQAYAVAIGSLGLGLLFNLLGRTGGALCSPDSPFQGHALWHVFAAIALGAWGIAAFTAGQRVRSSAAGPARHAWGA